MRVKVCERAFGLGSRLERVEGRVFVSRGLGSISGNRVRAKSRVIRRSSRACSGAEEGRSIPIWELESSDEGKR